MFTISWKKVTQTLTKSKVLSSSLIITGVVTVFRLAGLLQSWELAAFDQFIRLHSSPEKDERILIVGITEQDLKKIGTWPISDAQLAELLQKINTYNPRVIGLDIYRDLPIGSGHSELLKTLKNFPNIIGIENLNDDGIEIPAPKILVTQDRVGFNNVIIDIDKKVRRNRLLSYLKDKTHPSLGLKLALAYLKKENIELQPATTNPEYIQIGSVVFPRFQPSDGAYIRNDNSGYQILGYPRSSRNFDKVSMTEMLEGKVDPKLLKDKIVLIGSTAPSLKDDFYDSYSTSLFREPQEVYGVQLHANFVSQIISAVYNEQPLIKVSSEIFEYLWILIWCFIGANIAWKWRSPWQLLLIISGGGILIFLTGYSTFLLGWWIPVIPPFLGLVGAAGLLSNYLAYQEQELQRSKEFLQSVIDKIPDPIFVKDHHYNWLILNEAFCELLGYPLEELLGKTDADFFSEDEAKIFQEQDELVLKTFQPIEHEETFTNVNNTTYMTATKRSIHQDRAGNIFLVGVIRDITERKRMEEDLRRTAAELIRSNTELKNTEKKLRYLAYHDPLTGLANRKLFYESLKEYLVWGEENTQLVGLLFIDLDGFKPVNDTLGHDIGDLLLKAVAQRLKNALRSSDIVCRLGGDEFTAILPGIKQKEDGGIVADKILKTLSQSFMINGNSISVSASIGISVYPVDGENDEILIKKADLAMYQAKKSGRNQYKMS